MVVELLQNPPQSLADWLQAIEKNHPQTIQLGLERVRSVAETCGLHLYPTVITVAGTNGKGSCVALLAAILQAAGYRVGTYTSPHLWRFNERLTINGQISSDESWIKQFKKIHQVAQNNSLTYFEFITLAAFIQFQETELDFVILEVGLGGRLDAVNIIDPDISIITTIDYDHETYLGKERAKIALEKAGIFRPNKPAVCGDPNPPESLIQHAHNLSTPLFCQNRDFGFTAIQNSSSSDILDPGFRQGDDVFRKDDNVSKNGYWHWWHQDQQRLLPYPKVLPQNASTVLMAIELLRTTHNIPWEACEKGLSEAKLPGRQQVQFDPFKQIDIIYDVAHNSQSARELATFLAQHPCSGKTIAIVAMLSDKNIPGTITPLIPFVDQWIVGKIDSYRGCGSGQILETLAQHGLKPGLSSQNQLFHDRISLCEAMTYAKKISQPGDRIVVFGSFHTVSETLIQGSEEHG